LVRLISLLTVFLAAQSYAQVTLTMRLVERGTTNGIPPGEKVVIFTPKSIDTLVTQQDGYINGYLTDVKGEQATTTAQATTWITPQGEITNAGKITSAKLYNALGEEIADITVKLQVAVQHLANAPYFIQLTTPAETYTLKFVNKNGMIVGATQHRTEFAVQSKLAKTAEEVVIDSVTTIESDNIVGKKLLARYSTNATPINLGNREVQVKTDANIVVENIETKKSEEQTTLTINGITYNSQNGTFNIRVPKENEYLMTAQFFKTDGTKNSYKRTTTGTLTDTLDVVSYRLYDPKTKEEIDSLYEGNPQGLTPTKFKDFAQEANFSAGSNGTGYEGLKTFMPKENKTIIIFNKGPIGLPYTVTSQDQEAVKILILTELFPTIDKKYQPTIEIRTLTTFEPPIVQQGSIAIYPTMAGDYIGAIDDNTDGIIDRSYIQFGYLEWQNPIYTKDRLQELLSAFCAPNQVDGGLPGTGRFEKLSVLSSSNAAQRIMPIDHKLQKIAENYKPQESIDSILGN